MFMYARLNDLCILFIRERERGGREIYTEMKMSGTQKIVYAYVL